MQPQLKVLRNPPRNRGIVDGLSGSISLTIEALSYLHIGSSQMPFEVKGEGFDFETNYADFNRTGGRPCIPGSSVKGNIRSRIELSFRAKNGSVKSCFIRAGWPVSLPTLETYGWRHRKIWGDVVLENRGPPCDHTTGAAVCLLCDMFGTAGLRGLVEFSDFPSQSPEIRPLDLQYGIKIYAVPQGSTFKGRINFSNLKPEEIGLLFVGMGLNSSREGKPVLMGRLKYRSKIDGYKSGRVRYLLERLTLSGLSKTSDLHSLRLAPGQSFEADILDGLVEHLVSLTLETYRGELKIVDEVSIADGL